MTGTPRVAAKRKRPRHTSVGADTVLTTAPHMSPSTATNSKRPEGQRSTHAWDALHGEDVQSTAVAGGKTFRGVGNMVHCEVTMRLAGCIWDKEERLGVRLVS